MAIVVKNNNVGVSCRKVGKLCDMIRNKKASEALRLLRFDSKKEIALVLTKLINSGLAIAAESDKYDLDNLAVATIYANEGPTLKRVQPRAQGRVYRRLKRTSHLTVSVSIKDDYL